MPPARISRPREPRMDAPPPAAVNKDTAGLASGGSSATGSGVLGGWGITGAYGFMPGATGMAVSPFASLGISTAWACVKRLAEDNGKLPRKIMRQLPGGGSVEVRDHPLSRLLRTPNKWQTPSQFWSYLTVWLSLRGNAFAAVARGRAGEPVALIPLNNDRTHVLLSPTGDLYYECHHSWFGQGMVRLHRDNVIHVRSAISFDGFTGVSPISAAPDVFGLAMATQQHGATLFRQGAQLNGVIKHPGRLNKEGRDFLRQEFNNRFGGVQNAHGTVVLDEGMSFEKVTMTNEDAQFLESRQFSVPEVCFAPQTLVFTANGVVPISNIEAGELVLTHKGRWRRVTGTSRTAYVGPVLTVRAKGLDAVTMTPGHPLLVQRAKPNRSHKVEAVGNPRWVEARELVASRRQGDGRRARGSFQNLVMPRMADGPGWTIDLATFAPDGCVVGDRTLVSSKRAHPTPIRRHVAANADLGWVCGLYAADGSASDHQTTFYLGAHETWLVERLEAAVPVLFGATARTRVVGSVARVVVTSRVVAAFFKSFKSSADVKSLPAWCMSKRQSARFRQGLIEGLVDGDGHVSAKLRTTVVRSISLTLVWQLRLLLWAEGLNSSLCVTEAGRWTINGRTGNSARTFSVEWRANPVRRGSTTGAPRSVGFPLEAVETTAYAGYVHNLQVDGDESYTTVGGISHNCRMFGVPPHKVHDLANAHYDNMESGNLMYIADTLQPIGKQFEEECDRTLLFEDERDDLNTVIDYDELMRADRLSRYRTDEIGIRSGRLTQNEARISDGRSPNVPNGDQFLTPMNMASSDGKPDAVTTQDEKPEPPTGG